jgi:hypothetical protein
MASAADNKLERGAGWYGHYRGVRFPARALWPQRPELLERVGT